MKMLKLRKQEESPLETTLNNSRIHTILGFKSSPWIENICMKIY